MTWYDNQLSFYHKFYRILWNTTHLLLIRWIPNGLGFRWIRIILTLFGAKINSQARVYPSAKIYMPKNLIMDSGACLGANTNCYNVDKVWLDVNVTISQYACLITASHNIKSDNHNLVTAPIHIGENSWIASYSIILMGINLGKNCVVGAGSVVTKSMASNLVAAGNPARIVGHRYN